jgi:hypothetical protein
LNDPRDIVASASSLYVSSYSGGGVGEYNPLNGQTINANLVASGQGTLGLLLSGSYLFVANQATGTIGEFDAATGQAVNASFVTGLDGPTEMAVISIPEPSTYAAILGAVALGFSVVRRMRGSRAKVIK